MLIRENYPRFCPLSILLTILITVLCLIPMHDMTELPKFPGYDKVVHGVMFGALCFVIYLESFKSLLALVWAIGWGGLIEILQETCTNGVRTGDWLDLLSDGVGALLGLWVAMTILRLWKK